MCKLYKLYLVWFISVLAVMADGISEAQYLSLVHVLLTDGNFSLYLLCLHVWLVNL